MFYFVSNALIFVGLKNFILTVPSSVFAVMSQPLSSGSGSFCSSEGIGSQPKVTPPLPDSGGSLFSGPVEPSPSHSPLCCVKCKKVFRTRKGFIQHRALHIKKGNAVHFFKCVSHF